MITDRPLARLGAACDVQQGELVVHLGQFQLGLKVVQQGGHSRIPLPVAEMVVQPEQHDSGDTSTAFKDRRFRQGTTAIAESVNETSSHHRWVRLEDLRKTFLYTKSIPFNRTLKIFKEP
jgi:hypothetical protein